MSERHPELAQEQAYLEEAIRRGEWDRKLKANAATAGGDPKASAALRRRAQQALGRDLNTEQVLFTRLDGRLSTKSGRELEGPLYIGNRAINGEGGKFYVYSWAAEIASVFYRASAANPLGVTRRRKFTIRGARIEAIYDETFNGQSVSSPDTPSAPELPVGPPSAVTSETPTATDSKPPPAPIPAVPVPAANDDPVSDEAPAEGVFAVERDPLLEAALNASRTEQMREIVSTIDRQQYELIASEHNGLNVIQGGPGTGKTSVAIHRAALLLHRRREELLRGGGVLIVGPNTAFIDYIRAVLPSLGEDAGPRGAIHLPIDRLVTDTKIRAVSTESADIASLKGDVRMVEVLKRALYANLKRPKEPVTLKAGSRPAVVDPDTINELIDDAIAQPVPWTAQREHFQRRLVSAAKKREPSIKSLPSDQVDRIWPTRSATAVIRELFDNPTRRGRAADGILTEGEVALLQRKQQNDHRAEPWTPADIALLDEARALTHGDQPRYAYVIADEAQDLTPLQLRMLARRMRGGSGMLVGDLAQATGPVRYGGWPDLLARLGPDFDVCLDELTLGYRVPKQVMDLASALVPRIVPDLAIPQAIRNGDEDPKLQKVAPEDLLDHLEQEIHWRSGDGRRIGVIVPPELLGTAKQHFEGFGLEFGTIPLDGLTREVTLLTARESKGLEFDHVVVAEPHLIIGDDDDWALLYVALTRATQTLSVIHTSDEAIPPASRPRVAPDRPVPGQSASVSGSPPRRTDGSAVLGPLYSEALLRAKFLHDGQARRGSTVPYLAHLMAVSALVLDDGGSEVEAIAALFHDVVEDRGIAELEWIQQHFGREVAAIVIDCADPDGKDGESWRDMKEEHLRTLEQAGPQVRRVALAEKLENARHILRSRRLGGYAFWEQMDVDPDDLLWYLQELAELFVAERPGYMADQLASVVEELFSLETDPTEERGRPSSDQAA